MMKKVFSIPLTICLTFLMLMAAAGALSTHNFALGQGTTTVVGGAGGNPGGANSQVQFNNNGSFGGNSTLTGPTPLTVLPPTNTNGLIINQTFAPNAQALSVQENGFAGFVALNVQLGTAPLLVQIGDVNRATHLVGGAANSDISGTLTCAASTATKTFTNAFTSTPVIVVSDETTKGGVNVSAKSASAFTISCTGATDVVDYFVIGNPN